MASSTRIMTVVLISLIGVIVGIAAALLMLADGSSIPASILSGGAAFAGTVTLALGMVGAARHL